MVSLVGIPCPLAAATEVLGLKLATPGLSEERRMPRHAVFRGTDSTANSLAFRLRDKGRG
jgi:hypothetical protein